MLGMFGLGSTSATACVDMYLCIDGIEGESQSEKHSNCIDVLAWSWGLSQSGTLHAGVGGGAGKVAVQDISLTKWIDKSTPDLILSTANGKHLTKAELFTYKCGGENPIPYFDLLMEPVLVSSVSTGGSGGEDRLTENVTLNFQKVEWCYTTTDSKGSIDAEICNSWDIATNTE